MNAITLGRPRTSFDPELAEIVCERIAAGKTLSAACEELSAEGYSVTAQRIYHWLRQEPDTFGKDYARARDLQLERFADDVITLSDAAAGASAAEVQAAKLRTDNRKWLLSKLRSETYGDKLDVTSKGEALAAPTHQVDARIQSIFMQAAMRMRDGLEPDAAGLLE